ncbi:major facilitator superfamily domain-containing protein [Kockovaella imperatae]|uniref:Major facilitator superfamily domain-containing protein n=1 Tax=Kockovaella imperatae TaxID=4999 RepID=A0A1Y1UFT3_9TREE|nr:major facilitator superfamily domain-containing protein [Kockovaella imperatae]ORX36921.1 major facilitator superfamily domain-containing protein [Kockovaella imperatae]
MSTVDHHLTSVPSGSFNVDTLSEEERQTRYRKVVRKLDCIILPLTAALYLCAALDRGNIGNAKLQGLQDILGGNTTAEKSTHFSIALMSFYVTYILFNVPGNILATMITPNKSLALGAIVWGVASTAQAGCTSLAGIVVCRLFIGIGESAFGVAVALYYSLWYTRDQLAKRLSLYIGMGSIAGAFGGLIAYGVSFIKTSKPAHWQILFIIEGLPSVILSVVIFFFLPSVPESSKYLSTEERAILAHFLKDPGYARKHHFDRTAFKRVFTTPTTYLNCLVYMGLSLSLGSVSGFLPTIIKSLGYSAAQAQLFTVPPYAVAFVGTLSVSFLSDRYRSRGIPIAGLAIASAVGFAILIAVPHNMAVRYFAVFPTVLGVFSVGPLMMTWATNTAGSHSAAAIRLGFMNGVGQSFSILSSFMFPAEEGPHWYKGFSLNIAFNIVMVCAALTLTTIYRRENARRDNEQLGEAAISGNPEQEKANMEHIEDDEEDSPDAHLHDLSPNFRYIV